MPLSQIPREYTPGIRKMDDEMAILAIGFALICVLLNYKNSLENSLELIVSICIMVSEIKIVYFLKRYPSPVMIQFQTARDLYLSSESLIKRVDAQIKIANKEFNDPQVRAKACVLVLKSLLKYNSDLYFLIEKYGEILDNFVNLPDDYFINLESLVIYLERTDLGKETTAKLLALSIQVIYKNNCEDLGDALLLDCTRLGERSIIKPIDPEEN